MEQRFLNRDFFYQDEKIRVGFFMEHREIHMHSHEFWEISQVYEGRGTHYFADGETAPIKEGEFIFISPDVQHCIVSPPPEKGSWVRVCNLLITQEYMEELAECISAVHALDEYTLRNKIFRKEPFCIHLKDDSGSVNHLLMTAAHK